jgi:hypothetical protein
VPRSLARSALVACVVAAAMPATSMAAASAELAGPAPIAAGTSAANIGLNGSGRWVVVRWVARRTGTLSALHLRVQADGSSCRRSGRTGYGLGNGGTWHATTHRVLLDGSPDLTQALATQDLRPCRDPAPLVDARQGVVRLPMGLAVSAGQEYATVVRNTDPTPTRNWTSVNFLFTVTGIVGANGRNTRSPQTTDAFYGLDPRELVGFSRDGGRTWALPGAPYGEPSGRNFLPTYVQEYADGRVAGQPYYYTTPATAAPQTMVFQNVSREWTIRGLGAYSSGGGTGTLTLVVDGVVRQRVPVSGSGMLRASIIPTVVMPGQTVAVTSTGLRIQDVVADTAWGRLMGMHLPTAPWRLQGERNFSRAAPVYALPACGDACAGG